MDEHRFTSPLTGRKSRRAALRALGGAGFGAAFFLGARRPAAAHGAEEVAREAMAAVNQTLATGDASGLDAIFAPDLRGHSPHHRSLATGEEFSHDLAGLKAALDEMRRYFTDAQFVVEDVIAEEDKVAGRVTFRATPDAAAFGLPEQPAQPLEVGGVIFAVIADERVAEFWAYFDEAELMTLVGMATPAPAAGGQVVPVDSGGSYVDVSPAGLVAMLKAKTFLLINVHVPYAGEIEGTDLFIPYDQIEQNLDKLPADTGAQIVVYCRSGSMSAIAARVLVKLGYTNVWNLDGGMIGWEQASYPLVNTGQ